MNQIKPLNAAEIDMVSGGTTTGAGMTAGGAVMAGVGIAIGIAGTPVALGVGAVLGIGGLAIGALAYAYDHLYEKSVGASKG